MTTKHRLDADLEEEGREVCEATTCNCGKKGLRFIPRWDSNGNYAPISRCTKCGEEVPF